MVTNSQNIIKLFALAFAISLSACIQNPVEKDQPNILWVYLEDTSPLLSCYGNALISTPHIDNLAENGILYNNAGVHCQPCKTRFPYGN